MRTASVCALIGGVVTIVVGVLSVAFWILGVFSEPEIYPGLRLESPRGRYVAEAFGLGGGGAAGWLNEIVRIAEVGTEFDPTRQVVFRADYSPGKAGGIAEL